MPCKIIEEKSKKILYVDYRGLSGEEVIENLHYANDVIEKEGIKLMLVDFRESSMSPGFVEELKTERSKKVSSTLSKQAVIGIKGIKKLVFNTYNAITGSSMKLFNEMDQAKTYLIT